MKRPASRGASSPLSVLEAARQILERQHGIFRRARGDMLADSDPEALHDMRVASGRLRSALRLFRPFLSDIRRSQLNALLARFRGRLGTARDWEVWVKFLSDLSGKKHSRDPVWMAYVALQRKQYRRFRTGAMQLLDSPEYDELDRRLLMFLGRDLTRLIESSPGGSFVPYAAGNVRRLYRRLLKLEARGKYGTPEEMHALRKRIRRLRYWTEFAAPVVGPPLPALAKRLKALTTALGNVHDMDVYLERTSGEDVDLPTGLVSSIRRRRSAAVKDFRKAWKRLRESDFRKRVSRKLKKLSHGKDRE